MDKNEKLKTQLWLKQTEAKQVPEEIHDTDKFIKLSEHAEYCAVKRLKRKVKLKLRTPKKLFTLKVNPTEAEGIVKKLRCEVIEV